MERCPLDYKFKADRIYKFSKTYREKYKRENEKEFKGNVIYDITLGVIEKKKLPDIEDVVTLVTLGGITEDTEVALNKIQDFIDKEENKEAGLKGLFCWLSRDLAYDFPLHPKTTEEINNMEERINQIIDSRNKFNELSTQLNGLLKNMEDSIKSVKQNTEVVKDAEVVEAEQVK